MPGVTLVRSVGHGKRYPQLPVPGLREFPSPVAQARYKTWWLDSPYRFTRYDCSRFLTEEFKSLIDSLYKTFPDRDNTGAAGWSMGGFGALHNAITHPDLFGSAFSIKGGVDLMGFAFGWDLGSILGPLATHRANWVAVNIVDNICTIKGKSVRVGFYGGADEFKDANIKLDSVMKACGMPHTYWMTTEEHNSVPEAQMLRVLQWFDSTFTRKPTAVEPRPDHGQGIIRSGRSGPDAMTVTPQGRIVPTQSGRRRARVACARCIAAGANSMI